MNEDEETKIMIRLAYLKGMKKGYDLACKTQHKQIESDRTTFRDVFLLSQKNLKEQKKEIKNGFRNKNK